MVLIIKDLLKSSAASDSLLHKYMLKLNAIITFKIWLAIDLSVSLPIESHQLKNILYLF